MSTMIMNMSQGKIERDEPEIDRHVGEFMCSGCNPVLAMTQLVPGDKCRKFPAELANVDMELFLQKMYG